MSERVSISRSRLSALTNAAKDSPCLCAEPSQREHGGTCISCWALADYVSRLRKIVGGPPGIGDDYFRRRLADAEEEQRFREADRPRAEAWLREQRMRDANG